MMTARISPSMSSVSGVVPEFGSAAVNVTFPAGAASTTGLTMDVTSVQTLLIGPPVCDKSFTTLFAAGNDKDVPLSVMSPAAIV